MKKPSKQEDISSWAYNSLYGVPMSYKYAGHYKGIPCFTRDDVPEGMLYFINDDFKVTNSNDEDE